MRIIPESIRPYIAGTVVGLGVIVAIQIIGRVLLAVWGG